MGSESTPLPSNLIQSTFLPSSVRVVMSVPVRRGAAKPIEGAGSGGAALLDLKAALYASEANRAAAAASGTRMPRTKFKPIAQQNAADPLERNTAANAGLEVRRARDESAHRRAEAAVAGRDDAAAAHLRTKAAMYDALVNGGVRLGPEGRQGAFLVDFQRKDAEQRRDDDQYDDEQQMQPQQQQAVDFSSSWPVSSGADGRRTEGGVHASQRSEWERQALSALTSSASARALRGEDVDDEEKSDAAKAEAATTTTTTTTTMSSAMSSLLGEGMMSAREKHAMERRKRTALVALRRSMLHDKRARQADFAAAHPGANRTVHVQQEPQPMSS
jgi:hypothetical protein